MSKRKAIIVSLAAEPRAPMSDPVELRRHGRVALFGGG